MDDILPDIPFQMRNLFLQLNEISEEIQEGRKESPIQYSSDSYLGMTRQFSQHSSSAPSDFDNSSAELRSFLSEKAVSNFNAKGNFNLSPSSSEDTIDSIKSIFFQKNAQMAEILGYSQSSSASSSKPPATKAEKNRLAQQAYRKRKAEYITILETRSSLLSVIEEELKRTRQQLLQATQQLTECIREKELLLKELDLLKKSKKPKKTQAKIGKIEEKISDRASHCVACSRPDGIQDSVFRFHSNHNCNDLNGGTFGASANHRNAGPAYNSTASSGRSQSSGASSARSQSSGSSSAKSIDLTSYYDYELWSSFY